MIATLAIVVVVVACGLPLARLVDPASRGGRLLGEAILLGLSLPAVLLFAFSIMGLRWSAAVTIGAALTIALAAEYRVRRRARVAGQRQPLPSSRWQWPVDFCAALLLLGYVVFAIVSVGSENDFIGIWGIKGKAFFELGGIDWTFLRLRGNDYAHPDYPLLLPLIFDWFALVGGGWRESPLGLLYPLVGVAVLAVIRDELALETPSAGLRAVASLALVSPALSPWIGLGEAPLLAFGTVGLLLLRRGCAEALPRTISVAAVFLGFAASVKNEGLALCMAAVIAVALCVPNRRRALLAMWPIALFVVPWIAAKSVFDLTSYFARGTLVARLGGAFHPDRIGEIARLVVENTPVQTMLWCGIGIAIALRSRDVFERERLLTTTLSLQICAFIGAYLVTPFSLEWHVKWSWERLLSQVQLPISFLAVVVLVRFLEEVRGESGSDLVRQSGAASAGE